MRSRIGRMTPWRGGSSLCRRARRRQHPLPMADEVRRYRPCVGLALFNRDGLVFVGRRRAGSSLAKLRHAWQMPQGGIDAGEAPYDAALRELYEETNVRSVSLLGEAPEWL